MILDIIILIFFCADYIYNYDYENINDYIIAVAGAADRDFIDINSGRAPTLGSFCSVWGALELSLVILGSPFGHLGALGAHIRDFVKM